MGQRTKSSKKLIVQKETLRKLQLRPVTDEELRAAVGGMGTCTLHACVPSQLGC